MSLLSHDICAVILTDMCIRSTAELFVCIHCNTEIENYRFVILKFVKNQNFIIFLKSLLRFHFCMILQ